MHQELNTGIQFPNTCNRHHANQKHAIDIMQTGSNSNRYQHISLLPRDITNGSNSNSYLIDSTIHITHAGHASRLNASIQFPKNATNIMQFHFKFWSLISASSSFIFNFSVGHSSIKFKHSYGHPQKNLPPSTEPKESTSFNRA